jgi:cyclophilin family peptidyl-prolyl cis-trans isomerase
MNVRRRRSIGLSGLIVSLALVAGCTSSGGLPSIPTSRPVATPKPTVAPTAAATTVPAATAAPSGTSDAFGTCPTSAPPPLAAGQTRAVTIDTSEGQIVLSIQGALAPKAAANFVALAQCGFYNNVVFHRLVPDFVIQGGDPTGTGGGGPGYQFADEAFSGEYTRGTVAMANSGPNTNGSQFFICLADLSTRLPKNYTIFGTVTKGMDVVDKIAAMPNSGDQNGNAAVKPVAMTKVTVANP